MAMPDSESWDFCRVFGVAGFVHLVTVGGIDDRTKICSSAKIEGEGYLNDPYYVYRQGNRLRP